MSSFDVNAVSEKIAQALDDDLRVTCGQRLSLDTEVAAEIIAAELREATREQGNEEQDMELLDATNGLLDQVRYLEAELAALKME